MTRFRILCVDDDQDQCTLMEAALARLRFSVTTTTSPVEALELARAEPFGAIVTDLQMEDMDGLVLTERLHEACPDVPVIVITGQGCMDTAIGAVRVGAFDFITKPVDVRLLAVCITRAVQHVKLRAELQRLKGVADQQKLHLVGGSPVMQRMHDMITRVGASDASVLICGETGTGKELVARAVHECSPRRSGPFVALNCAALPPSLLESELFGHARGAFTDAKVARQGLFVEATGGTLFLDEIGELPLEMQAKLLRTLQERKVRPVGANAEISFDARIVTATHRDLDVAVQTGLFRQDLYYRINVLRIDAPPLRQRSSDISELAAHFIRSACARSAKGPLQLSLQVAERLQEYDWPGNVRELENCMERAVALARFDHLTVEDLPEKIRGYRADQIANADDVEEILPVEEIIKRYVIRAMKVLGGNKARAAELLGLDSRTLYRKLESYGLTAREPIPAAAPEELADVEPTRPQPE